MLQKCVSSLGNSWIKSVMFYESLDYFTVSFILTSNSELRVFYVLICNPRHFLCDNLHFKR